MLIILKVKESSNILLRFEVCSGSSWASVEFTAASNVRWLLDICRHWSRLAGKEACTSELSLLAFSRQLFLDILFLLGQQTRSIHKVACSEVKDWVLCANAVLTGVRVRINEALLFHAERVYHLSHSLDWLGLDNALSNVVVWFNTRKNLVFVGLAGLIKRG